VHYKRGPKLNFFGGFSIPFYQQRATRGVPTNEETARRDGSPIHA
jgi:hypothetical protein